MKVSVITVNYNETATTCALLDSIRRQKFQDLEVIVVDNASRENPAPVFSQHYPEIKFIRCEQNLGFAAGNNRALSLAQGEFLFFVNNDAEIAPGCLEKLLQLFDDEPAAGIVSPLICYFPPPASPHPVMVQYAGMTPISPFTGRNRILGAREEDMGQYQHPFQTAYAHGAAMMVPRKVLEQVGTMWEGFFLYYEELDWSERIRKAGFEVWVQPRARVWHKESYTIDKMGTTKTYFMTLNRIRFMRRNFKGWPLAVFLLFLLFVTVPKHSLGYLVKGDIKNLKAFLKGAVASFGPISKPLKVLD